MYKIIREIVDNLVTASEEIRIVLIGDGVAGRNCNIFLEIIAISQVEGIDADRLVMAV
jgi:hypothetical protein